MKTCLKIKGLKVIFRKTKLRDYVPLTPIWGTDFTDPTKLERLILRAVTQLVRF